RQLTESLNVVTKQEFRLARQPAGKRGVRDAGDPLVRFLDTREYDDEATEFSYGIPQLLKLMNTNLTAASAQAAGQLARQHQNNHARVIEDIYLTALARRPTAVEQERMVAYVRKKSEPVNAYAGVFWALINSAEFVSNH